jgi:hypothetical protein
MSVDPTPQRLGRAVRYFTPVVLASALAVPMISSADSEHAAAKKNTPNGKAVGHQTTAVETVAPAAPVAAETVAATTDGTVAAVAAERGNGNGHAWGTAHNGDQGNGKGNGNGNDMSKGGQGDDKPGNGPKDHNGDGKPGNGPKDHNGDGKPGNGPKDHNGDGKPGNGPKDPKPGNGPKDPKPGNGPKDPKPGNGPKDPKPGNGPKDGKDGQDGKDGTVTVQPGTLTSTPVVTTVPSKAPAACKSARRFRIHLSPRKLRRAKVTLNGKRVRVHRTPSGAWAMINLRGMKAGTQVVRTRVVTKGGKVRRGVRRYKTCATVRTPMRKVVKKRG